MKLTKYFMPFAALALLASCSNDNVLDPQAPNLDPADLLTEGQMITTIKIAMPAGNGTRDVHFDGYDDGDASEYKVKNGKLLVFVGSENGDENNFPFLLSGTINMPTWAGEDYSSEDAPEITATEKEATVLIEGFDKDATGAVFYGLVILNTADDSLIPAAGTTFGEWRKQILGDVMTPSISGTKYFTMTNAPKYVADDKVPATLVALDRNAIYTTTEFAALTTDPTPAAKFYVQRGVAKVTVKAKGTESLSAFPVTPTDNSLSNAKVKFNSWMLDVTNTETYPVQIFDWKFNAAPYDGTHFHSGSAFNRVWWAEDPNYSVDASAKLTFKDADTNSNWLALTGENVQSSDYCLENTMEAKRQFEDQSTRVVFNAQFDLEGNGSCVSFIEYAGKAIKLETGDIRHAYGEEAQEPASSGQYLLNYLIADDEVDPESGEITTPHMSKYADALGCDANGYATVNFYKAGQCYYVGIIRHFSDEDTEWADYEDDFLDKTNEDTYMVYTDAQLGRYGVVRNNSYELVVNSIKAPGEPTFPDPQDDPDPDDPVDKDYKFVLEINILAWGKRVQNLDW